MPKTTVKKSSRSVARTRRTSAKRTAVRDVALYVPYKRAWWVIDIIKLLGSARCSGLAVEHQQQTNWCWAAVSNSVSHFYDAASTWTECSIVDAELGQSTCCTNGSSAACNQSWYLDKALTRVGRLQSWASGTLTFASVQSLINNGRPPCARQGWSGGGGHFMGITCYFEGLLGKWSGAGSTAKRLRITAPWYGDSVVDYTVFVSGYQGTGSWTHSYHTQ